MLQCELKSLNIDQQIRTRSRLRSGRVISTDSVETEGTLTPSERPEDVIEELKIQLARTQEQLTEKAREVTSLTQEVQSTRERLNYAEAEATREREYAATLRTDMDALETRGELTRLRALEQLRQEHQLVMNREAELLYAEQQRWDTFLEDLRHSHQVEKDQLQRRIAILESSGKVPDSICSDPYSFTGVRRDLLVVTSTDPALSGSSVSSDLTAAAVPTTSAPVVSTTISMAPSTTSTTSVTTVHRTTGVAAISSCSSRVSFMLPSDRTTCTTVTTTDTPLTAIASGTAATTSAISGLSPTAGDFVPTSHVSRHPLSSLPSVPIITTVSIAPPPSVPVSTTTTSIVGTTATPREPTEVMEVLNKLVQVQTDVMAAQARATAVQNLPSVGCFTGGGDTADRFDGWIERFEERAKFAGWSGDEQLYQLKLHLDKSALEVFRMLPAVECDIRIKQT